MLPNVEQNRKEWNLIKPLLKCYIPDENDAELAADLQISLRHQGWQLATVDALIASVAIRYNLILLTTDKDFSTIPKLHQENWLDRK